MRESIAPAHLHIGRSCQVGAVAGVWLGTNWKLLLWWMSHGNHGTLACDMDPTSQPFKVLAVDDSAMSRKLVAHSLLGAGYEVLLAQDGREALDRFAQHQPAVVITDWNMPDIGGLELCRRIRQDFQDCTVISFCLQATPTKNKS